VPRRATEEAVEAGRSEIDRRLPAAAEVEVPYYEGLTIGFPDLPAVVGVLADGRFDAVHLTSPGPSCIAAGLIAAGGGPGPLSWADERTTGATGVIAIVVLAQRVPRGRRELLLAALRSVQAGFLLATSRLVVVDDYFFPMDVIRPRAGTSFIQVWHACGALKRFGYSLEGKTFVWGEEFAPRGKMQANTWQGEFPWQNLRSDGFEGTSPVGSFRPNGYGLFDMAGNVWEWTSDLFSMRHPDEVEHACCVPHNPHIEKQDESLDVLGPAPRHVIKGGSHLCAPNYCLRYRPAARQAEDTDTSTGHIGFRCVVRDRA